MKTKHQRLEIALEIIRRADTVSVLYSHEVEDIKRRAQAGEFDTIFDNEADDSKLTVRPK